jgi:glycosyltransferase involved in cell wall biosynthesis
MDVDTLFAGLEQAMAGCEALTFVSTGGPVEGHDQDSHARFWSRARSSRFAARFESLGRLPRGAALEALASSHVLLSVSRPCLEAEVGSRQRLVEALAHGRPVVATLLGDLAAAVQDGGAGLVVPPGDPDALAAALLRLARNPALLRETASRARALWEARFREEATTEALQSWLRNPLRWPASALDEGAVADLGADRIRLQSQLDEIRASTTFRALRLFDRLLGRGRAR